MSHNNRTCKIDNILLSGYVREYEENYSTEIPDLITYIISMFCKEYLIETIGLHHGSIKPKINRVLNILKQSYLQMNLPSSTNAHVQRNRLQTMLQIASISLGPHTLENINKPIIDIQSSTKHTLILTSDGKCYGIGSNESGQLGLGSKNCFHTDTPTLIEFENKIKAIACGELHSLFIDEHGTLFVCGYNYCGQLGMEINTKPMKEPLFVPESSELKTQFLQTDDIDNEDDYIVKYECVYTPIVNTYFDEKGINLKLVACGSHHSVCITTDGSCYTFGHNGSGNLGNGKHTDYGIGVSIPYKLDIDKKFKHVSCGQNYNILLTENNDIIVFGNNQKNQCSVLKQMQFDAPYSLSKETEFAVSENAFVEHVICMQNESVSIVVIDVYKRCTR